MVSHKAVRGTVISDRKEPEVQWSSTSSGLGYSGWSQTVVKSTMVSDTWVMDTVVGHRLWSIVQWSVAHWSWIQWLVTGCGQ